jgi:hypothetical protein
MYGLRAEASARVDIMIWMALACLLIGPLAGHSAAPQDPLRDAVNLGRTHDQQLYASFHSGYSLASSGEVERVEIITEFRRAVLIVREHADMGEYSFNENNLTRALAPYRGLVTFVAQLRLNPLHTYPKPPAYEMYVQTGPLTKPVAPVAFKRDPVYPPGFFDTAVAMTAFRLEATMRRNDVTAAPEPILVITNDRADVIWQARLDLSRFR